MAKPPDEKRTFKEFKYVLLGLIADSYRSKNRPLGKIKG
jgi:hypothetical protein